MFFLVLPDHFHGVVLTQSHYLPDEQPTVSPNSGQRQEGNSLKFSLHPPPSDHAQVFDFETRQLGQMKRSKTFDENGGSSMLNLMAQISGYQVREDTFVEEEAWTRS